MSNKEIWYIRITAGCRKHPFKCSDSWKGEQLKLVSCWWTRTDGKQQQIKGQHSALSCLKWEEYKVDFHGKDSWKENGIHTHLYIQVRASPGIKEQRVAPQQQLEVRPCWRTQQSHDHQAIHGIWTHSIPILLKKTLQQAWQNNDKF